MADLGGDEGGMDLNLNLSPPSTPHLGLALGLGVGPTSPVSAASANEVEGSIPGSGAWARRQFEGGNNHPGPRDREEFGRYRSRHRWRRIPPLPPPPSIILRAVDHSHSDTELQQRNPHAQTSKENPATLRACSEERNENNNASNFECNICLEMARDPVVTSCGHLFCWACLYQWLHVHSTSKECPVCKGEVIDGNITPIYGRGNSDHGGNESKMVENGEKIPPRPRAKRIESLRQRFGRPISRRFMDAIRLTRRREAHNDYRSHMGARQDEPTTTTAEGVENLLGAAADQILNSLSLVHFHRHSANLQRSRSGEDRLHMRQVLARRSLLRPNTSTTSNNFSVVDVEDRGRSRGEGERERERESVWGHLQFGRLHRSERVMTSMEEMVESLGNNNNSFNVNEQGLQGVVRSGVSDNNRERASISSTNAMIQTGSRNGDAVVEQDSGISSSPQRRRHAPSCSLDSDGGLLSARKRRRLN